MELLEKLFEEKMVFFHFFSVINLFRTAWHACVCMYVYIYEHIYKYIYTYVCINTPNVY